MMWISGPSSSGKTTTTVKLTERLQKHGLRFLMLNLDDYFWSLVEHPTDWINDRNYETPEAMDIQLLNSHLRALLAGETIEKPIYSFKEGRRMGTKPVRLEPGPGAAAGLSARPLPPDHRRHRRLDAVPGLHRDPECPAMRGTARANRLTRFTDIRLMRRMLRDAQHRNHRPLLTILHWHYVRSGELFSIIPLNGLADHVINGGFPFDLPVLKAFLCGPDGWLPKPEDFAAYSGFLDATSATNACAPSWNPARLCRASNLRTPRSFPATP